MYMHVWMLTLSNLMRLLYSYAPCLLGFRFQAIAKLVATLSLMGRKRKARSSRSPSLRAVGGRHQQAAALAAACEQLVLVSALAKWLLQQWAWGFKTAFEVQKEAKYAVQDMLVALKYN